MCRPQSLFLQATKYAAALQAYLNEGANTMSLYSDVCYRGELGAVYKYRCNIS